MILWVCRNYLKESLVDGLPHIYIPLTSGWWFQTFFIFAYIGNNKPNWRTHIFQRGRYTTNQITIFCYLILFYTLLLIKITATTVIADLNWDWTSLWGRGRATALVPKRASREWGRTQKSNGYDRWPGKRLVTYLQTEQVRSLSE